MSLNSKASEDVQTNVRLSLFVQAASMLLRRANGVYKQNNCTRLAVISKMLLLQHDVRNRCIYKQHWPNKTQ